ncbi:TetR/AcrR family transcriptional regulator, transcriptional repressor for nem operon [Enterococcus sp. AZ007]
MKLDSSVEKGESRLGRKKEFDKQLVLKKAMDVFWKQGYEHTSMQDLVDAMTIHRRSIYDTFGDKHHLFIDALKLYEEMLETVMTEKVSEGKNVQDKLKHIFSISIAAEEPGKGCLIVNTATELSSIDPVIAEEIRSFFGREEQFLFNILLSAQEQNELSPDADIASLASYIQNALVGIRVLSKTTNDNEKLDRIIEQTLSIIK